MAINKINSNVSGGEFEYQRKKKLSWNFFDVDERLLGKYIIEWHEWLQREWVVAWSFYNST